MKNWRICDRKHWKYILLYSELIFYCFAQSRFCVSPCVNFFLGHGLSLSRWYKSSTQESLLFSIFSFKHFNQYLPRQLKGSNSFPEEFFLQSSSLFFFYFVFIPQFILTLTKKKLTSFPQIYPLFWFLFYKGNEICHAAIHHLHCSTMSHLCVKYKTKAFCEKLLK